TRSISVNSSGSFTVQVTDNNGCQSLASAPVTVTVNPLPLAAVTPSGPTTFCAGGSVTLDAGGSFASYLWNNGATTRSISVNSSGSFTVQVTDANGCQSLASAPVTVTVNPLPLAAITPSGPTTFCAGGSVTLDAGAGFVSYLWNNGATTPSISVN